MERFCVIPELGVGGTPDRVAAYVGPGPLGDWYDSEVDGDLITDVKTGNVEYGILKMAGQLGVYSKARFYDHLLYPVQPAIHARTGKALVDPDGKKAFAKWKREVHPAREGAYAPMGSINPHWGVIIHLPSTGEIECTLHWLNLDVGWEVAEEAVRIREMRRRASAPDVMFPVFGDKSFPFPALTTVDLDG